MNKEDEKMLDFVEFVTDNFAANHQPWTYSRDLGDLEHIRFKGDYTGHNHWTKRLKEFGKWVTVRYWKPTGFMRELEGSRGFFKKLSEWPMRIRSWWRVAVRKDSNRPDGQVNGILTQWEEDGEYITMFCPYVGREVLKFLRAEPDNPFAQKILRAMRETQKASWGSEGD